MSLGWKRAPAGLGRRLAAAAMAGGMLGALTALPATPSTIALPPARAAASGPWLDRLNLWRASTGVSQLGENATWSAGDYDHAVYMVKNNLVTHYETAGTPYYTSAGNTAASDSNIYVSSSTSTTDPQAIDWWMQAPFHAMGLMDPRLTTTGFGSYREVKSGWDMGAAVDVLRGNPFTGGKWPVVFPGNGTTEPLTSYDGYESPNPLSACSGYTAPSGLPLFVMTGGNVSTTVGAHSLTANGVALANCVIDSHNASLGSSLTYRGAVVMIPKAPLQNGVTYNVSITVNGVAHSWSFKVGQFSICNPVSTPAPASPGAPGTAVAFSGSSTGCPNPLYEYWVKAPGASAYTLAQTYSTTATFNWSTTGLALGTYAVTMWVRDASSTGISGNSSGRWDSYVYQTYTLQGGCLSVDDAPSVASPQVAGTTVVFTAAATGCSSPLYEFWIKAPGASAYTLAQNYGASATYSWATAGKATGAYAITVWTRDATSTGVYGNSSGRWDAYNYSTFTLGMACASVTDTPAIAGTTVTFTARASGCPTPQYEFWLKAPGAAAYTLAQAYGVANAFAWSTTGSAAGTYAVTVWVRDASSTGTSGNSSGRWDAYNYQTYKLS